MIVPDGVYFLINIERIPAQITKKINMITEKTGVIFFFISDNLLLPFIITTEWFPVIFFWHIFCFFYIANIFYLWIRPVTRVNEIKYVLRILLVIAAVVKVSCKHGLWLVARVKIKIGSPDQLMICNAKKATARITKFFLLWLLLFAKQLFYAREGTL